MIRKKEKITEELAKKSNLKFNFSDIFIFIYIDRGFFISVYVFLSVFRLTVSVSLSVFKIISRPIESNLYSLCTFMYNLYKIAIK